MQCCIRCTGLTAWFHSYDHLQTSAIVLLYLQVICALVGSLGAFYTGVLVANLALALFGLVAIESGSQTLGRAYAALLAAALLVDTAWFILFSVEIRDPSFGRFSVFSVWIVFGMQVASCSLRFLSSLLWVQMYRLGAAADNSAIYQPVDFEGRIATFGLPNDRPSPSHAVSISEEILGGSIYNPSTFSSLFQYTDEPYFGKEAHKEALNGPNLNADSLPSDSLVAISEVVYLMLSDKIRTIFQRKVSRGQRSWISRVSQRPWAHYLGSKERILAGHPRVHQWKCES